MLLTRFLRWPLYPAVLRWPLLAVTGATVLLSLAPPRHSEMNVGAALVWQLWWAALPFTVLLTARAWCAVCPFPLLGDLSRKLRGQPDRLPSPAMRRAAAWLGVSVLAILGLLFLILALERNGQATAVLLLLFVLGAATSLLWLGQAWCRYVCPVGLLLGLYSRLAWLRLEPGGDAKAAAMAGSKVCPMYTSPASSRRAHDCTLCSACMKTPEGGSIHVRFRRPSLDGQLLSHSEAVAVTLLLGLMLADAVRMVPWYLRYMAWGVGQMRWSYEGTLAAGIVAMVLLAALVVAGTAAASRGQDGFWMRFAFLSLTILPIVLATQLALSSQHLMAIGEVLRNLGAELRLLEPGHMPPANAYSVVWPAKLLQAAILAAGTALSMRVALGEHRVRHVAPVAIVAALALTLFAVFAQPMSVTC